eukprot:GGOE01042822.1.p1 GENE.GGOE01042822.1~~GGOE01042822.1.p1  ORF type:complete len:217 (-),score=5.56 GGOE01042822.1:193-843(-)
MGLCTRLFLGVVVAYLLAVAWALAVTVWPPESFDPNPGAIRNAQRPSEPLELHMCTHLPPPPHAAGRPPPAPFRFQCGCQDHGGTGCGPHSIPSRAPALPTHLLHTHRWHVPHRYTVWSTTRCIAGQMALTSDRRFHAPFAYVNDLWLTNEHYAVINTTDEAAMNVTLHVTAMRHWDPPDRTATTARTEPGEEADISSLEGEEPGFDRDAKDKKNK